MKLAILILLLLAAAPHTAWTEAAPRKMKKRAVKAATPAPTPLLIETKYRGWDHLAEKLLKDGFSKDIVEHAYLSTEMPVLTFVPFSVTPRESSGMYRHFVHQKQIKKGAEFLKRHRAAFDLAEKRYHVSRYVVAAILLVETQYGLHTGRQIVLHRLSRLASAGVPENIEENLVEQQKRDPAITREQVIRRAEYLERTFYPEVRALLEMALRAKVNPLGIRGSYAGALGMPQFLPSAVLKYGVDGDADGFISLFEPPDAIASTANYLKSHGWNETDEKPAKRAVILKYNLSEPYADTVLAVAARLREASRANPGQISTLPSPAPRLTPQKKR